MTKYNVIMEYTTEDLDEACELAKDTENITFFSIEDVEDEEYTDVDEVDASDDDEDLN